MSSKTKKVIQFGVAFTLIGLLPIGWVQRWNIYDSWRLKNYQAPAQIAALATQTTMNDKMRRLFYVYHPELSDKASFSSKCNQSEQTIVLGCYIPSKGIYLYNVADDRLNGVAQITAAHEALHAAYDRLSGNDKKNVNTLIDEAYQKVTDQRIRDTIEDYRKNGADVRNELHSILATEVHDLSPPLEHYYARYFTNRLALVNFSDKYENAFTERRQKIAVADQRLDALKKQIDGGEAELATKQLTLKNDRARLDALYESKNYEAYNAAVGGFNAQVNSYNASVGKVRASIDEFNSIVVARNAIAAEQGDLIKAIDSRPNTLQTQ